MSATRGNIHEFLGMSVKFTKDGKVTIGIRKHILWAFEVFLDKVTRTATSLARAHLFNVNKNAIKRNKIRANNFHSVVALLLFV